MNPDPFENRLEQLQPRSLPPGWRRGILAAAVPEKRRHSFFAWLPGRWPTATFAAAWVVIVLLRLNTQLVESSAGPAISAGAFAEASQEKLLLIASIENPPSIDSELPVSTWPFPFEKRPL